MEHSLRAKSLEIVIGDAFLLSKSKLWNEVIQSCKQHVNLSLKILKKTH